MKKTTMLLVMVGILSLMFTSHADALTTTPAIAVIATIQAGTPDMSWTIRKTNDGNPDLDPWTNSTPATNLTFDNWGLTQKPGKDAQWASATQNYLIVYATGMGDNYQILADGAGALTGAGGTLPAASFMCTPIYSQYDKWWVDLDNDNIKDPGEEYVQGAIPAGAQIYTSQKGQIIGVTSKQIYTSESPVGSGRIIQIQFMFPAYNNDGSVPFTGYVPILATQAAGSYTGATVTVRIVAM